MGGFKLHVYSDLETLSRELARRVAKVVREALDSAERFTIALAGGSSPRSVYRLLGLNHGTDIPWQRVHFFWGDERYLPLDDPRSNYRMARESLLAHIPVPSENVHPMPTDDASSAEAAKTYEKTLRDFFAAPWPCFDLVLLGIGGDGHTASLFPGSPALAECERWVVAVEAPVEPPVRLTLTLPVINHAWRIYFLAAGAGKAEAVRLAFEERSDPLRCPAAAVRPTKGTLEWWLDRDAARLVEEKTNRGRLSRI